MAKTRSFGLLEGLPDQNHKNKNFTLNGFEKYTWWGARIIILLRKILFSIQWIEQKFYKNFIFRLSKVLNFKSQMIEINMLYRQAIKLIKSWYFASLLKFDYQICIIYFSFISCNFYNWIIVKIVLGYLFLWVMINTRLNNQLLRNN